jgi:hypothetical protein
VRLHCTEIARLVTQVYRLSPAALTLPDARPDAEEADAGRLARQLSGIPTGCEMRFPNVALLTFLD